MARQNERQLADLSFEGLAPAPTPGQPVGPAAAEATTATAPGRPAVPMETGPPATEPAAGPMTPAAPPATTPAASDLLAMTATPGAEPQPAQPVGPSPTTAAPVTAAPPSGPHQPAASDTDSPSRGIPRAPEPGKEITGGFGETGDSQYFPLDGTELRELLLTQIDALVGRLENDLRFSIAVVYPRVSARVVVEVEGYAEDQDFVVPRVMVPHDKTPIEVARAHGASEVTFAVSEEIREMSPEGESEIPPNAIREKLGLSVPRKQRIDTPTGGILVDQVSALSGGPG